MCVDADGDGHGFQCQAGEDCDDADSTIFEGCQACARPSDGCACEANAKPVDCTLPKELSENGALLCKTGTRYCRDGAWSGCEGIKSFAAPPPSRLLSSAIIDPDAAASVCDACDPDCYRVEDPLGNLGADASLGPNVVAGDNGGITLSSYRIGDGGVPADSGLLDQGACTPGTAPDFDCDNIPDDFDPYPAQPPFSSDHNTIFMDLAPGDTQSQSFEIRFYLNTADIYLYLDMTGSMGGELSNLISSLRTGNFLANGGTGLECADRNFNGDTSDEEYLKNDGIAGNLACLIRDSHLGTGWHRDIPFPKPDDNGFAFGPHDFEAFGNEQDLTGDVDLVSTSLNRFHTRGGINRPEGGIMGLYSIATGAELYTGWDRPGNPARTCPTGTWGYPCFRDDAVPIVIWMTDAPSNNGPAPTQGHLGPDSNQYGQWLNQPVFWGQRALDIEKGSDGHYTAVSNTNESFASAYNVGDINSSFKTYAGDTSAMASDLTYTNAGVCSAGSAWLSTAQGAPDAVFKLSVTQAEPITISTRGSRFQTTLAIIDSDRIDGTNSSGTLTNAYSSPANPFAAGTLTFPTVANFSGTTASGTATFSRDSLGCLSNSGAGDKVAAGVVKFNLQNDVSQLRIVSDGAYALSTSLFAAKPGVLSADVSLSSMSLRYANTTKAGNANDTFNQYNLGNLTGAYKRFTNGDLTDTDLTSNFTAAAFTGATFQPLGSCSGVTGTGNDAVYDFSLSATTRLRIEGTGNNTTLQSSFDHAIALVQHTTVPHVGITGNFTDATAYAILPSEVPSAAYSWSQYNGVLGGTTTQYVQSEVGPFITPVTATDCNYAAAANANYTGVFVMDVTGTQSYDFDTSGSSLSTWLSIHKGVADTQFPTVSTNLNNSGGVQALGAMDEVSTFVTGGSLSTHGAATADFVDMSMFGCSPAGTGGRDAIYSFTVASAQNVSVTVGLTTGTALVPGVPAFNSNVAVFRNSITVANRIAGNCTDQAGNGAAVTDVAVTPGNTYYIVVKSFTTGSVAGYGLWVRDTTFGNHFQACDYASQVNNSSTIYAAKMTRTLDAGRYFILVKGATTGAAYQLNVRRTPSTGDPSALACDHDGVGSRHSMIERTLPAGNYSLIMRGYATGVPAAGQGAFNVIFRDMGVAPDPVSCQYDANGTYPTPMALTNLAARDGSGTPIDYYLVMRGNTTTGAYTIRMEDGAMNQTQCAFDNVSMTYTQTTPYAYTYTTDINNAEWTGTLPIGDYYVVLKGYNQTDTASNTEDDDWGMYQLTVGDQTNFEQFGKFADQRWLGPNGDGAAGVRKALLDHQIRVITVDSTTGSGDDPTYSDQQMRTIAQSTDATALDGTPLFFKINSDGTGMGSAIVNAVNQLAGNLAMDVSVRLVESPDSPAPKHFRFLVEAIDTPGDLCQPPIDADGDAAHTPDTHVNCTPGAVPRFKVTLANPNPPNNVGTNPADPNGGWNMRLDLIGDNQYVVDQIPVYIIPEDVIEEPGDKRFDNTGTYEQNISAVGCFNNEAPLWRTLAWSADIPSGTTLIWRMCTADTVAALAGCTLVTAATVQTGSGCANDSDCPNGYCNDANLCEFVLGPACSADADCGVNGVCVSGACQWTNNPIDVKPALLRSLQGQKQARVQVEMLSNAAHTRAPTVNSWGLKYTCTAQE